MSGPFCQEKPLTGPFDILRSHPHVSLVFPPTIDGMAGLLPLLQAEKAEFEAVLGTKVVFVEETPETGPTWVIEVDPALPHNALAFDRDTLILTSRVRDSDGILASLNLMHSLAGLHLDTTTDAPCATLAEAAERVAREIAGTFPGFGIRGKDWAEICARHDLPGSDREPTFEDFERWIAELDDAHTAIRRPGGVFNPPYVVEVTAGAATFRVVPENSAAHAAGVRSGWILSGIDCLDWLSRTGAPSHGKPFTTGRRAIALNGVDERAFTAYGPRAEATWTERKTAPTLESTISWTRVDDRTACIRLDAWWGGIGLEDAFDTALSELRGHDRLILDLQRNTGGNLVLATQTRNRFLRERTLLGTIAFTTGDGRLAAPVELWADPEPERVRWDGQLIVLTDPMTYSASEDFLLGLQGLDHVTVIGQRSGGGSGRPRTIALTDEMLITISTALTFDRNGVCIENHGVPVDIETDVFAADGANLALDRARIQ
jgi:carboxyl-terminal processing protease